MFILFKTALLFGVGLVITLQAVTLLENRTRSPSRAPAVATADHLAFR